MCRVDAFFRAARVTENDFVRLRRGTMRTTQRVALIAAVDFAGMINEKAALTDSLQRFVAVSEDVHDLFFDRAVALARFDLE